MAHPAVQLYRIYLARTWYFTAFQYCDFVAIKFAKVLSYRDFMRNPDRGVKRQYYNLTTVLIRLNRLMSCHLHKTEFICFTLDSGLRQRLYLLYVLLLY